MRSIRLTDTNTLSTSNNIVIIKPNWEDKDSLIDVVDKVIKSAIKNSEGSVVYIDDAKMAPRIKGTTCMIAHDMRKNIQSIHNAIFINLHYSPSLVSLAEGTDNYLVTFECPEYEQESCRAKEELEDMTD